MLLRKDLAEYNRYQACALHLAISLIIFLILLVCITQYWYPGLLLEAANGWKAIGMIFGIDLILGPALTFIVFNPRKNSLKLDLTIIAIIQSAALIYGSWTIHQSHPIALAHVGSHFHIIYANAPFADEINDLAIKSNHQLYYLTKDEDLSANLKPEQFYPYSEYKQTVLKERITKDTDHPYIVRIKKIGKPYGLKLDPDSGKILSIEATNVPM